MLATISSTEGAQDNVQKEVERLVLIGVFDLANDSEWGSTSFAKPKPKLNWLSFLSDLSNLNKRLKHQPYPMPKINEILLKLEGFK